MYSEDLRERVVAFYRASPSNTYAMTAATFQVSLSSVRRWVGGFVPSGQRTGPIESALGPLATLIEAEPCTTYQILQARLREAHGIKLSVGSIFNAMRELGISRKRVVSRKIYGTLARTEAKREVFRQAFDRRNFQTAVSIDETHFYAQPTPRYGYSHQGKRILKHVRNSGTNHSCVAAMDRNGLIGYTVHEGSIDGTRFAEFLHRVDLKDRPVVLDNASIHRSHVARTAIDKLGCRTNFIPPLHARIQSNRVDVCPSQGSVLPQHVRDWDAPPRRDRCSVRGRLLQALQELLRIC